MDKRTFQSKLAAVVNSQKIHLTLNLGEVKALIHAAQFAAFVRPQESEATVYLIDVLRKLDAAIGEVA